MHNRFFRGNTSSFISLILRGGKYFTGYGHLGNCVLTRYDRRNLFAVIFVANLVMVVMFIVSHVSILVMNSANGISNCVQLVTVSWYPLTKPRESTYP